MPYLPPTPGHLPRHGENCEENVWKLHVREVHVQKAES